MRRIAAPLLWLALAAVACNGGSGATPTRSMSLPPCTPHGLTSVGEQLPDCVFESMGGPQAVALKDFRGAPLVLNFWASWCPNCIREMPAFERVHLALAGSVRFLGMDLLHVQAETRSAAQRFAVKTGVSYTLAYDTDGLLYGHFGSSVLRPTMPTTIFVDARGVVTERTFGELLESDLREAIRKNFGIP